MKIEETKFKDLFIIKPYIFEDNRGYFMESFKKSFFDKKLPKINFIQENESKSSYGVLRGFHFQIPPFEQSKLVRCINGEILDVVVDMRKNSLTFGKYFSVLLSDQNKFQLFIPKGFAHAFLVLSKEAIFSYKVDNYYSPDHDSGFIWNDKSINVNWNFKLDDVVVSKKDQNLSSFKDIISSF